MSNAQTDNDFMEHEKTYDRFIKLVKWSVVAMVVLVLFLYVMINP